MTDYLTISLEHLTHFQCPACKGWWSIGDAPKREHWFCPWCGEKSFTKGEIAVPVMVTGTGYEEYTYSEILEKYFPGQTEDGQALVDCGDCDELIYLDDGKWKHLSGAKNHLAIPWYEKKQGAP